MENKTHAASVVETELPVLLPVLLLFEVAVDAALERDVVPAPTAKSPVEAKTSVILPMFTAARVYPSLSYLL